MAPLLKNLYNEKYVSLLATNISLFYKEFDVENFTKVIFAEPYENLELKERMRHISTLLGTHLPPNYRESIEILKQVFSSMNYAFSLENMIFQDYVEVYGLNDFETSMDALDSFTKQSSSEFAIRKFILTYPEKTLQQMILWTASDNEHVRRLASEGCRPRLPWAISLPLFKNNPNKVLEILTLLKDDESKYVRKSVANSLNDISKDNPEILKRVMREWIGVSRQRDSL